jgi:hypothetical protein
VTTAVRRAGRGWLFGLKPGAATARSHSSDTLQFP